MTSKGRDSSGAIGDAKTQRFLAVDRANHLEAQAAQGLLRYQGVDVVVLGDEGAADRATSEAGRGAGGGFKIPRRRARKANARALASPASRRNP